MLISTITAPVGLDSWNAEMVVVVMMLVQNDETKRTDVNVPSPCPFPYPFPYDGAINLLQFSVLYLNQANCVDCVMDALLTNRRHSF